MKLSNLWATASSLALLFVSLAPAQTSKDFAPSKFELDLFAGADLFHKRPDPLQTKLLNSMVFGTHVTENLWRYWSLEQSLSGTTLADLTLLPFPGAGGGAKRIDLEQRVWKLNFNPVYHLTPIGSRIRPFLTAGYTQAFFAATKDGKLAASQLTPTPIPGYKSSFRPALNYGGGFKARFTDLVGMRFDLRGLWSGAPTWGLPTANTGIGGGPVFIPKMGSLHGMEATAGIDFNFGGGHKAVKPITPPVRPVDVSPPVKPQPDPPKAILPRVFELSPIEGSPATGYVGDPFTYRTRLTDSLKALNIVYAWTVDGAPQAGATGPELRTSNLGAGSHEIRVTATDPATGTTATTGAYTMTVNPIPPLTITDASDKPEVKFGDTARLSAQGSQTAYSGPLSYTWNTNVGSIKGTGPGVTFDSSTVPFDPANVFKPESRTATITPTVTDQRGRTATGSPIQIRVNKDPQAMRLDDLVYGKGSARVNNCAKRILIDELQGLMTTNPDVEVLLIGHIDADEPTKGAKGRPLALDHQRVYNAAAVLTAGTGVCAKCDLNRVKVSFAGSDQTSDFRSGFCGTSTRTKTDERKSGEIAADDAAAKNRRVEIWIVPKGVGMPGGAKDVQAAPVRIVKAKGCPK